MVESDLSETYHPTWMDIGLEPKYVNAIKEDNALRDRVNRFVGAFGSNSSELIPALHKSIRETVIKMVDEKLGGI